jgi:hypothetical protein
LNNSVRSSCFLMGFAVGSCTVAQTSLGCDHPIAMIGMTGHHAQTLLGEMWSRWLFAQAGFEPLSFRFLPPV